MASEVAHPETLPHDSSAAALPNGDHNLNTNADAFGENAVLPKTDTSVKVNTTAIPNPGGPTPIEDVAPGITPVADFIPKDARTSHPTPPPDEPLATSEANVDTAMTMGDEPSKVETLAEPVAPLPSSGESSLVRQREEDDEDEEPAAKRSRVESSLGQEASDSVPAVEAAPANSSSVAPSQPAVDSVPETAPLPASTDIDMAEAAPVPSTEKADVAVESTAEADAKPAVDASISVPEPSDSAASAPAPSDSAPTAPAAVETPAQVPADVSAVISSEKPAEPSLGKPADVSVSAPPASTAAAPAPAAAATPSKAKYSTKPVTKGQQRFLQEKMKNLKKTKNSTYFVQPVDVVALNIPTYADIVKQPMDLSTMEKKLKEDKYASVQDFADDFHLIISNCLAFNGPQHPVTQAGFAMEAYFRKMMESVPSADQPAPQKTQAKKASPKPPSHQPARRESRSVVAAAAPSPVAAKGAAPAAGAGEAFALQANGTPQIRRDSTINRPARAIKPPPARELPYAKPKRKEHQLELKFCDHVLSQLKSARYSRLNVVFMTPVDPVALNIPHYRQIVKHPMDLSTMSQKLKNGEYGKASEVKKDFELMIENCLAFNPHGNPVRDLGIEFRREFETLWNGKDKWEKAQKQNAQRGASASADDESADEDDEDDDEPGDDKEALIRNLQKQLEAMQNVMSGLTAAPKQKKAKSASKSTNKKASSAPKPKPAPKSKTKKPKQVTYEEKQEISEAVGRMNEEQVAELTRIITENCKKYADQEEMELEIDDLPNDVQAMLLKYVRSIFGNPTRGRAASPDDMAAMDDDDFEPERGPRRGGGGGGGSKRKKHKPMGKEEQEAKMHDIQRKLAQFKETGMASGQSPSQDADTSGDDESEESEEE